MKFLAAMFSFRGRLSRIGYWRSVLWWGVATTLAWVTAIVMTMNGAPGWAPMLLIVPYLASAIALAVRRLHDRNRSGWWLIVFQAVPWALLAAAHFMSEGGSQFGAMAATLAALGLSSWAWVEIGFLKGTKAPNRFGAV